MDSDHVPSWHQGSKSCPPQHRWDGNAHNDKMALVILRKGGFVGATMVPTRPLEVIGAPPVNCLDRVSSSLTRISPTMRGYRGYTDHRLVLLKT